MKDLLTIGNLFLLCGVVVTLLAVISICLAAHKIAHPRWRKCSECGWWFSDLGIVRFDNPGIKPADISNGICPDCARAKGKLHDAR